jgi:hypothetical protein
MKPEWSGNPEVWPVARLAVLSAAVAFTMLTIVFAFYW